MQAVEAQPMPAWALTWNAGPAFRPAHGVRVVCRGGPAPKGRLWTVPPREYAEWDQCLHPPSRTLFRHPSRALAPEDLRDLWHRLAGARLPLWAPSQAVLDGTSHSLTLTIAQNTFRLHWTEGEAPLDSSLAAILEGLERVLDEGAPGRAQAAPSPDQG